MEIALYSTCLRQLAKRSRIRVCCEWIVEKASLGAPYCRGDQLHNSKNCTNPRVRGLPPHAPKAIGTVQRLFKLLEVAVVPSTVDGY